MILVEALRYKEQGIGVVANTLILCLLDSHMNKDASDSGKQTAVAGVSCESHGLGTMFSFTMLT